MVPASFSDPAALLATDPVDLVSDFGIIVSVAKSLVVAKRSLFEVLTGPSPDLGRAVLRSILIWERALVAGREPSRTNQSDPPIVLLDLSIVSLSVAEIADTLRAGMGQPR